MQNIQHLVRHVRESSFRSDKVAGMFDVEKKEITKRWSIDHDISEHPWTVGAIVGPSGSGKSTIAKKLFGDFLPSKDFSGASSVVDHFPATMELSDIIDLLTQVGFSSPPSWLLPYGLLSTGQQFRTQLAYEIATREAIVFDEFTSVVDRTVAAACSHCVAKYVRKNNKKFTAVSCHYDILPWLQPDWVIDMADGTFSRRSLQRPEIKIGIYRSSKDVWSTFAGNHYLSADISAASRVYVGTFNGRLAALCADLHFPHPKVKNMRRIHRLVTLPDFQGFGIGPRIMGEIARINKGQGLRTGITTGHPGLCATLNKLTSWKLTSSPSMKPAPSRTSTLGGRGSAGRLTASYEWVES